MQAKLPQGTFLWELIQPQASQGQPTASRSGKYHVKCFVMDQWRQVTVDDRIPVDAFGTPILVGSMPLQLWPLLLSKAVFKLMSLYQVHARLSCLHVHHIVNLQTSSCSHMCMRKLSCMLWSSRTAAAPVCLHPVPVFRASCLPEHITEYMQVLDTDKWHEVSAFQWLTGWPQENLLDPLHGPSLMVGLLCSLQPVWHT